MLWLLLGLEFESAADIIASVMSPTPRRPRSVHGPTWPRTNEHGSPRLNPPGDELTHQKTPWFKVFFMAVDCVYQLLTMRWIYPVESIVTATILAIIPYVVLRGVTNRIARTWIRT